MGLFVFFFNFLIKKCLGIKIHGEMIMHGKRMEMEMTTGIKIRKPILEMIGIKKIMLMQEDGMQTDKLKQPKPILGLRVHKMIGLKKKKRTIGMPMMDGYNQIKEKDIRY